MIPSDPPKHDTWKPQFFSSGFAVIVSSSGSVNVTVVCAAQFPVPPEITAQALPA